jgi:hypothetical protein
LAVGSGHNRRTEVGVETLAQLESAFAALGGEYHARKQAAEKLVRDWQ